MYDPAVDESYYICLPVATENKQFKRQPSFESDLISFRSFIITMVTAAT